MTDVRIDVQCKYEGAMLTQMLKVDYNLLVAGSGEISVNSLVLWIFLSSTELFRYGNVLRYKIKKIFVEMHVIPTAVASNEVHGVQIRTRQRFCMALVNAGLT